MDKIVAICHRSGAQAVHPGYGFLSENALFADNLSKEGIVFIGPPASAIISMGSKSESKSIMSAVHGGGGKGMRTVHSADAFLEALTSAQREAQKSFGNADVLVEKYIIRPRHVEVQVFADTLGNCVSLWERDCSVQRRNQKIIEEAPAPGLTPEMRADLSQKAIDAALAVNYVGAGTVEFIFDNDTNQFFFMEMNTRLQVEHPVSEMITGLDLVEWQLEVAAGNQLPLPQSAIPLVGHAFEARIYAENPRNNFLPDSGSLLHLSTPTPTHVFAPILPSPSAVAGDDIGVSALARTVDTSLVVEPSLRLEQGFGAGAQIGVFYDPMIAKLVVHGRDRTEALRVLRKALEKYEVVGLSTNIEFLRALAANEAFVNAELETGFIPKHFDQLFPPLPEPSAELLAQAALYVVLRDKPVRKTSTPWTSLASRRFGGDVHERIISLQTEDTSVDPVTVRIKSLSGGLFDVTVRSASSFTTFNAVPGHLTSPTALSTTLNSAYLTTTIVSQKPPPSVPASTAPNTMERLHVFHEGHKTTLVLSSPKWLLSLGGDVLGAGKDALKAPMPSVVVEVKVAVGDKVEKGQAVVVLESMKTETVLRAEVDGIVKSVGCAKGEMVEEGRELVNIETGLCLLRIMAIVSMRYWLLSALCVVNLQQIAATTNFTSLVNLFIGTASGANGGSGGNAFPGAAIPHAMVKVGIDVNTAPRQAGYVSDNSSITGISLMHDEGTGGNTDGGYGIFPLFPLINCNFTSCPVGIDARAAKRAEGADVATPGLFGTAFVNGIKLETTSTRRAGLIRFTYPPTSNSRHVVVDLTHDLGRSFEGGNVVLDRSTGHARVQLTGTFLQSYGTDNYTVHACYDFDSPAAQNRQSVAASGIFQSSSSSSTNITITPAKTSELTFPFASSPSSVQAGALLSFDSGVVFIRFGVSFISAAQACTNAEEEIPDWDWDKVINASVARWEDVLSRVTVDVSKEDPTVVELLYSSLYRASLVPANLTDENPYWDSPYPFYDALFCSWDTFRTVHPLLSLTSPREWAETVNAYIDGWRHTGIVKFSGKYARHTAELNISTDDLYKALVDTATNTPSDWYTVGRQNTAWTMFDFIPTAWVDPSGATGLPTREASRTLEYAVDDFAVRRAAITLNKSLDDVYLFGNRSVGFVNVWDPNVTSDGFSGFAQRRFANGTFAFSPPDAYSPIDPVSHSCARGTDNDVGFYESSSWEYSFFAPHSMATLVNLMGGNDTFISRLDHYFSKGYFFAGNEPSFAVPWAYHYANRTDLSALRVRNVVYDNFNTGIGGIPGNDDSGAMAALLTFHILGLYPTPFSWQLLVGSPLVSSYTIKNNLLGTTTTVTVNGFDNTTLTAAPPSGSNLFVKKITVNGKDNPSLCWLAFDDLTGGGKIVIDVDDDAASAANRGCGEDGLTSQKESQALADSL
ncbi:hypothetical protein EUX98_g1756 [Antrodiella citrinella]|uniref:Biotin carboxylase n=1 Tax=Antrodiella citrinella TaxID=2447956 RepID=A0A4S4N8Z3_9APHY|nr:hypothetical protein EUX98_g1756 [Antrodiella citrinella]